MKDITKEMNLLRKAYIPLFENSVSTGEVHKWYLNEIKTDSVDEFQFNIMKDMMNDFNLLNEEENYNGAWDSLNIKSLNEVNEAMFNSFPIIDKWHKAYLDNLVTDGIDGYHFDKSAEMINLFDSLDKEECWGNA